MSVKEEEERCNSVSRKSEHRQDQKAEGKCRRWATNTVLYLTESLHYTTLFDIFFWVKGRSSSRIELSS